MEEKKVIEMSLDACRYCDALGRTKLVYEIIQNNLLGHPVFDAHPEIKAHLLEVLTELDKIHSKLSVEYIKRFQDNTIS